MRIFYIYILYLLLSQASAHAETPRSDLIGRILLEFRSDTEIKDDGVCVFSENQKPFSRRVMLDCETLLGNIFLSDKELPLNISAKVIDDLILYGKTILESLYVDKLILTPEKEEDATIFAKLYIYLKHLDELHPTLGIALKSRKFFRENLQKVVPIFEALKDEQSVSKLIKLVVVNWKEDSRVESQEFLSIYFNWYLQGAYEDDLSKLFERFTYSDPKDLLNTLKVSARAHPNSLESMPFIQQLVALPSNCLEGKLVAEIGACSFLESLPNEVQDKLAKAYLFKFDRSMQVTANLKLYIDGGYMPSFVSRSEVYQNYAKETLFPLLEEKRLASEDVLSRFNLSQSTPIPESPTKNEKSGNWSVVTTIFLSLLVVLVPLLGVAYKFKFCREFNANIVMTKEERAELRDLKIFFSVTPFASIRDLSKSYRLKVRNVHPDSGNADSGVFLDLQNKYARIKELQEKFLESRK